MRVTPFVIGILGGWLAVCGPVAAQDYPNDPASAYIEIVQGDYRNVEALRIYADDRIERRVGFPNGATSISDTLTGAYTRMARYLASEGPAVAALLADSKICPDWGEITIRANPAVAGISAIRAACPDSGIEPLRDQLLVIAGR